MSIGPRVRWYLAVGWSGFGWAGWGCPCSFLSPMRVGHLQPFRGYGVTPLVQGVGTPQVSLSGRVA